MSNFCKLSSRPSLHYNHQPLQSIGHQTWISASVMVHSSWMCSPILNRALQCKLYIQTQHMDPELQIMGSQNYSSKEWVDEAHFETRDQCERFHWEGNLSDISYRVAPLFYLWTLQHFNMKILTLSGSLISSVRMPRSSGPKTFSSLKGPRGNISILHIILEQLECFQWAVHSNVPFSAQESLYTPSPKFT